MSFKILKTSTESYLYKEYKGCWILLKKSTWHPLHGRVECYTLFIGKKINALEIDIISNSPDWRRRTQFLLSERENILKYAKTYIDTAFIIDDLRNSTLHAI